MSDQSPRKTKTERQHDAAEQLARFKEIALEVGADDSPDALDRAFSRLDMKKKAPAKRKAKQKQRG